MWPCDCAHPPANGDRPGRVIAKKSSCAPASTLPSRLRLRDRIARQISAHHHAIAGERPDCRSGRQRGLEHHRRGDQENEKCGQRSWAYRNDALAQANSLQLARLAAYRVKAIPTRTHADKPRRKRRSAADTGFDNPRIAVCPDSSDYSRGVASTPPNTGAAP